MRVQHWTAIRNTGIMAVLFGIVLLCFVWGGLYYKVQSERQLEIDIAFRETANFARTFEEHTVRTLKGLDIIALSLKQQLERDGLDIDLLRLMREERFAGQPYILLGVLNEKGDLLANNLTYVRGINNSDRDFFSIHRFADSGQLFIGKPTIGRGSGKMSIQLSRRINKADGSFGGVVVVSADPSYFAEYYKQVNLGEGSSIALIGRDKIVRVRQAGNEISIGDDFTNSVVIRKVAVSDIGNFIAPSPIDSINRIYSYRALKEYPLIVVAGLSEAQALYNLNQRIVGYYWACGATSVVIVIFVVILLAGAAQRRSTKLQAVLLEISEASIHAKSPGELYRTVHQAIARLLPAKFFLINLLDEKTGEIVVPYRSDGISSIPERRPVGKGMTEYIMNVGKTVLLKESGMARLRETGEYTLEQSQRLNIRQYLGAPLTDSLGKPIGTIALLVQDASQDFYADDTEIISIIAAQVSLVIERMRAEDAVRESETRYRTFMDQSFEALVLLDIKSQVVVEVNRKFTELLGYSLPADAPLHNSRIVVDTPQNIDKYFNEIIPDQKILLPEIRTYRHKNGTEIHAERAATVINLDGNDYLLVSMRDVTAERRRQKEIARAAEYARRVQRELLPKLPESPYVALRTVYCPYGLVSGDSYQIEWVNNGKILRGFLIDVSGHGLPTAIQTSAVNVLLREAAMSNRSLAETVQWINVRLIPYFTEGSYAAIIAFELDFAMRELRYVGAGITQFFANGKRVETPGMFVGLWERPEFCEGVLPMSAGDSFIFLTDGFSDILARPENKGKLSMDFLEQLAQSDTLRDDATGLCLDIIKTP